MYVKRKSFANCNKKYQKILSDRRYDIPRAILESLLQKPASTSRPQMKYSPEIVVSGPMKKMGITILLQCSNILGKKCDLGMFQKRLGKKSSAILIFKKSF